MSTQTFVPGSNVSYDNIFWAPFSKRHSTCWIETGLKGLNLSFCVKPNVMHIYWVACFMMLKIMLQYNQAVLFFATAAFFYCVKFG